MVRPKATKIKPWGDFADRLLGGGTGLEWIRILPVGPDGHAAPEAVDFATFENLMRPMYTYLI
jgi:hypothetical protein